MADMALPTCEQDVADAVADALRDGVRLAIAGGGSKAAIGAPAEARPLPMSGLRGVVDYDPAELVLTVRPGTPLREIEALVAGEGQRLAFDPFDHGPVFGQPAGAATIGGVAAAGVSGSQRVSAGAVRDHLLGFRAVSGRGEAFAAGGKVVKNVTGFDLPKLAAGSWGRLFALTELTLKVLPRPRESRTLMLAGLSDEQAVHAMSRAMGSQADVAAAAHLPGRATILRVQGFGPSVAARRAMLDAVLADFGRPVALPSDDADAMWAALRTLSPLGGERPLWRISIAPSRACAAIAPFRDEAACLFDWAGGLIWAATQAEPGALRAAVSAAGGHAMLVRADAPMRAAVPTFHPASSGMAALETRVRRAFDPMGLFETGRF